MTTPNETQTPTAAALSKRLQALLSRDGENKFFDEDLQARLRSLRPRDIDAIKPPSIMACGGVWVNDAGFCRRLGALLFNVSDETVDDLSVRDYQIFTAAVCANFTAYLEGSTL